LTVKTGVYTCEEVVKAKREIIRLVQESQFATELHFLRANQQLPSANKHLCLNPFLDQEGIIRVGGRLRNADVPYDQKHPILLPRHHHITTLIIMDIHEKSFHAGPQLA